MSTDRKRKADPADRGARRRVHLRQTIALAETISLICFLLRLRQDALSASTRLSFQWQLVIFMIAGSLLPLIVMGGFAAGEMFFRRCNPDR